MKCGECVEFLIDYVTGELPPMTREEFERHLALCANCVTYLEQYRLTIQACRRAFEDLPADVPEELIRAILAARTSRP